MKSVYIQISQIYNAPGNDFYKDSRTIRVTLNPNGETDSAPLAGLCVLCTKKQFSFVVADLQMTSVTFVVSETKPQNLDIARLTLPLRWFQLNACVRECYPMKPMVSGIASPIGMIEFHVSDNGDTPFHAPLGRLLVTPGWRPPPQSQTPYVAPESEDLPFVTDGAPTSYQAADNSYEYSYYSDSSEDEKKASELEARPREGCTGHKMRRSTRVDVPVVEGEKPRKAHASHKLREFFRRK